MAKKDLTCHVCNNPIAADKYAAQGGYCYQHIGAAAKAGEGFAASNPLAVGPHPSVIYPDRVEEQYGDIALVEDQSPVAQHSRTMIWNISDLTANGVTFGQKNAKYVVEACNRWNNGVDPRIPYVARKRVEHGPDELYELLRRSEGLRSADRFSEEHCKALRLVEFSDLSMRPRVAYRPSQREMGGVYEVPGVTHRAIVMEIHRAIPKNAAQTRFKPQVAHFVIDPTVSALAPVGDRDRQPVDRLPVMRNTPFSCSPYITGLDEYQAVELNGSMSWGRRRVLKQTKLIDY